MHRIDIYERETIHVFLILALHSIAHQLDNTPVPLPLAMNVSLSFPNLP